MPCSNTAKMQNQRKFARVPQTGKPISDASRPSSPYCGDMWRTYCCLTSFFPIADMCLSCEDIARQSCAMVPRRRFLATFLRPVLLASRVQQVSDRHLKFALRPHHVWQTSNLRRLRLGEEKRKKKKKKKKNKPQHENIMVCPIT